MKSENFFRNRIYRANMKVCDVFRNNGDYTDEEKKKALESLSKAVTFENKKLEIIKQNLKFGEVSATIAQDKLLVCYKGILAWLDVILHKNEIDPDDVRDKIGDFTIAIGSYHSQLITKATCSNDEIEKIPEVPEQDT